MSNVMLSIIGILLAAAAALTVVFYGGTAFGSGSIASKANTVTNLGVSVRAGFQMYQFDNVNAPSSLSELLQSKKYLSDVNLPSELGTVNFQWKPVGGLNYFTISIKNPDVCTKINVNFGKGANQLNEISGFSGCAVINGNQTYFIVLKRSAS